MLRGITIALGSGLVLLWLSGLGLNPGAARWMTWLDLAAGLCTFGIAGIMRPHVSRGIHSGGAIFLALLILAIALLMLSSAASPWQAWWNFFLAGGLFLVGLGALINVDWHTLSVPWREPRQSNLSSLTGFGHGFLTPHDHLYPFKGVPAKRDSAWAPRQYRRSDQRIEEDIYDRFSEGWELDASEIRVSVKDGEVTLLGSAQSRSSRRRAEEIVDNVLGVKDIHNELQVHSTQAPGAGEKPNPRRAA